MRGRPASEDFRLLKCVLEVRYPKAHRYWDECGQLISALELRLPGLVCQRLAENGFQFTGTGASGLSSAVFYWDRAIAEHDSEVTSAKFAERTSEFWSVVAQGLDIQETTRVGNRYWLFLRADSATEAESWLESKPFWRFTDNDSAPWGQPLVTGSVLYARDQSAGVSSRIELGVGKVKAQNEEHVGVVVDVDFKLLTPPTRAKLDVGSFLKKNERRLRDNLVSMLGGSA